MPTTQTPPGPTRNGAARAPRPNRKPVWPRSASASVLRLGLLIGGLIIIVDLAVTAMSERTINADEINAYGQVDDLLNYVLFSVLGILVVRQTGLMYAGIIAGVFASLLDAIVVTAASVMAAPSLTLDAVESGIAKDLVIGMVFAGLSGVMYALAQRWSGGGGGQRPRG